MDLDQEQREQFRDVVKAAMREKAWSAARLAKEAVVSTGTMTRLMKAEVDVSPRSVEKIRAALGIAPLAAAQAAAGYPTEITFVRDIVGMAMLDMPASAWAGSTHRVLKAIYDK